ncbi:hypothetical protein SLE2022_210930 [Rubroshorea leprosula]
MVHEYEEGWSIHLEDTFWVHRMSSKTAISFSPFLLVYGYDVVLLDEVLVPTTCILAASELVSNVDICCQRQIEDLESIKALRQIAQEKFAANWDGRFIIIEAHDSGYYHLKTNEGKSLPDPVNVKWLKPYHC